MKQQTPSQNIVARGCHTGPPYPERLSLRKPSPHPEFIFLGEMHNLFVKILLLHALKDIPIYAKIIKEYCSKKPGRKPKDPLTIHVMGKLSDIMLRNPIPVK